MARGATSSVTRTTRSFQCRARRTHLPRRRRSRRSDTMIRGLLREPLVQFLGLGLLLFLAYQMLHPTAAPPSGRIEITPDDVRQIALAWMAQGRPAPTPDQMQALVDSRVREEILYREAIALGLDKGDTIVRRRMVQKMTFLFEDVAALHEPTDDELRQWFGNRAERFTRPP